MKKKNSAFSQKEDDSLLFGKVVEIISQAEGAGHLADHVLEQISIFKKIPFCACFEQVETRLNVLNFYASFADFPINDIQLSFPDCTNKFAPDESFLIIENADFKSHNFHFRITGQPFKPQSALIIKCSAKSIPNKYFLFLNDARNENQFAKMLVVLQPIAQLITERLDKLSIVDELTKLNEELDQRVTERTIELTRINKSLSKEIIVRKIIEQALSENEKKLQSVSNAAIDVSFVSVDLSKKFIIRSFSPGSEKMFGYSAREAIGKPMEILHFQSQAKILASIRNDLITKGLSRKEEVSLRRKSGELFPAILTVYPLKDDKNNLIGALGVSIDITELKRTQNESVRAREKSEESEYKFRSLFEQASDGIFILDDNGNFLEVNENGCEMLGYTRDELLHINLENIILTNNQEQIPFSLEKMNTRGSALSQRLLVRKDRSVIPVEIKGSILSDGRWQGIVRDITEHKKFEADLITAKEKAEESDRLKTAFLQNMSHEIRTPMNAIMGFADLLPEHFNDKAKLDKFAKIIKNRGLDLLEIITEILDIAKIESGQLLINPEEYNMNTFFDEIELLTDEYKKRTDKNHIEFKLSIEPKARMRQVLIDQIKLKQILINLIRNALKFTNEGIIEVRCHISEPDVFTFSVSDTGIGIQKEKHTEIFTHFMQASSDKSQLYGGTGLGLSIVQGLLNLLGGKIWLESEKGKGSTFYFTMPFGSNDHKFQDISKKEMPKNTIGHQHAKILIVEDDEFNAEYLVEILADTDCEIIHTCYGRKAVEICEQQAIDVVLMDIRLPDISGYEVTSQIKKLNPEIKVIAQTAYATNEDRQKSLESGCDDYLSKPIGREFLLSRIEKLFPMSHKIE